MNKINGNINAFMNWVDSMGNSFNPEKPVTPILPKVCLICGLKDGYYDKPFVDGVCPGCINDAKFEEWA